MKLAATAIIVAAATIATSALAEFARHQNWGSGDPCQSFAATRGTCTPKGRWKTVNGKFATYYLPDGRTFVLRIVEAEVNGALDSQTGPPDPDAPLDDELDHARMPR